MSEYSPGGSPCVSQTRHSLRVAFESHPSRWRENLYVYPVISRRSRGLSIGINLNPDLACNFDCIYCQVDRTRPPRIRHVDLDRLERELRQLVTRIDEVFRDEAFAGVPPEFRPLRNFAFSGDGEPTRAPELPAAARIVAAVRAELPAPQPQIVLITNACFLRDPPVEQTLAFLDAHGGQVWAKLDAGSEKYFRRVNVSAFPLQHILDNILHAGRARPIFIQSMFLTIHGQGPSAGEIDAYIRRLEWLVQHGCRIAGVQVYTVARRTARPYVAGLHPDELYAIARRVQQLGLPAECFA